MKTNLVLCNGYICILAETEQQSYNNVEVNHFDVAMTCTLEVTTNMQCKKFSEINAQTSDNHKLV